MHIQIVLVSYLFFYINENSRRIFINQIILYAREQIKIICITAIRYYTLIVRFMDWEK